MSAFLALEYKRIKRATPGNGDWETRLFYREKKKRLPLPSGCACVCVQVRKKRGREIESKREEWENDRCSSRQSPCESARKREGPSEQQQHFNNGNFRKRACWSRSSSLDRRQRWMFHLARTLNRTREKTQNSRCTESSNRMAVIPRLRLRTNFSSLLGTRVTHIRPSTEKERVCAR